MNNLTIRPRRNRTSQAMRDLVGETRLTLNDIIAPLFCVDRKGYRSEISSMPGQYRFGPDLLLEEIKYLVDHGIKCISLFPAVDESLKTAQASESFNPNGFNQKMITAIKEKFPELLVMSDIALDPYSSDGHDGLVDHKSGEILNDETLSVLGKMALAQAKAGSDILGPSDMMDGRVGYIRKILDENNFKNVSIMSYTAKYASAFYGPFRDALDSAPKKGDKKTYQMDYANRKEALREAHLDTLEGADILMVKPALSYLDIISDLKQNSQLPIAAYNVSGEYAMIVAAAKNGWLDQEKIMLEVLTSIKRAGADIILTYFAKDLAKLLH